MAKAKPKPQAKPQAKRADPRTLARAGDPATSHEAAAEVAGSVAAKQRWAAACVRKNPKMTARELAKIYCPEDPREIGRRLPECVRQGTVKRGPARKCSVSGKKATTWEPGEPPPQPTLF